MLFEYQQQKLIIDKELKCDENGVIMCADVTALYPNISAFRF